MNIWGLPAAPPRLSDMLDEIKELAKMAPVCTPEIRGNKTAVFDFLLDAKVDFQTQNRALDGTLGPHYGGANVIFDETKPPNLVFLRFDDGSRIVYRQGGDCRWYRFGVALEKLLL